MMNKEKNSVSPNCKRWSYDDIKEANFMRFLLEVRFTEPIAHISLFEFIYFTAQTPYLYATNFHFDVCHLYIV